MHNSFIKILSILLIVALNWGGLSAVVETIAYYLDNEGDGGNTFTAATLDFSLTAGSWSGNVSEFKAGDSASKTITINNSGSLGFQYIVEAVKTSGNDAFCNALQVVANRNGGSAEYTGSLLGLTITPPIVYESAVIDVWDFTVSLLSGSYPTQSCGFSFKYTGWQTDFPDASSGFSDVEEDANTFIGALGQACDPDDVTLPTDFDQAYWIDEANDGGVVEGSFVFPNNLMTPLELGPTEIKGNLTFGTSNTATIKGPIYVHGNLTIGAGTRITQDSGFGDNFAVIIVDGTITIADDVVFTGSGTTGAFLLVSRAAAGSTAIDILDGTIANGNLGDGVLFAVNGNIHIGDNRTVLNAFVVTEGSSGSIGSLSPSASANVDSGGTSWSNLANSYASDDSYATVSIGSNGYSDYLQTTGFGFDIDDGATISGIELRVERKVTTTDEVNDNTVRLRKNSGTVGNNKASGTQWETAETTVTYGGPTDLWGTTWTPSDINNANFGSVFAVEHDQYGSDTISVDYMSIKVYWTIAGQTITYDPGASKQGGTLPSQAACGPQFMDLNQVVINEFVPNISDIVISTTIFSDSFGIGTTDSTFDESPTWNEGDTGAEKRATGSGNDTASPNGDRFAVIFSDDSDGDDGWICRTINTTGYSSVQLSYYWRGDSDADHSSDDGLVQIKPSSGNSCSDTSGWTTLQNHDLQNDASWLTQSPFGNPGMENTSFLLKFVTNGAEDGEYFRIDGITITGEISAGSYSTGLMPPTANVQNGAGDDWSSPTNAYGDGGGVATDNEGEKHQYYNFGFSIPTGATIDGIEVSADAWSTMSATDTGFLSPDVAADVNFSGADASWSDVDNAKVSDNNRAFVSLNNDYQSRYLRVTDFDFNIPADSTINGIEVRIERSASESGEIRDYKVQLVKTGVIGSTNRADTSTEWGTSDTTITYGGSSDLWGTSWTYSDINNVNTGVVFSAQHDGGGGPDTAYVDHISMRVYYTPPISSCQLGLDLSWNGGTSWTSEKTTINLTGAEQTYTLGGSADNWGYIWISAEINSNFRARVHSCTGGPTTNLDWLRAKIYYTVNGEQGSPGEPHDGEWVELYNGTGSTVDVDGWALYDAENTHELLITSANTNTGGTTIPAGGYLVVYRDGDADFDLDNTTDMVRLYNDQITTGGTLVDFHNYNYLGGAPENKSFARVPDGTANWVDPQPTPGESNNVFVVFYLEEIKKVKPDDEENIITIIEDGGEGNAEGENNGEITENVEDNNQEGGIVDEINETTDEITNETVQEIVSEEIINEEPMIEEAPVVEETPVIEEMPNTEEVTVEEILTTEEQPVIEEVSIVEELPPTEENTPVIIEQPIDIPNNNSIDQNVPAESSEDNGGSGDGAGESDAILAPIDSAILGENSGDLGEGASQ